MAWQFVAGDILTAANLNAVTLPWNALCNTSRVATQSITNNTITAVLFDTDDLDPLSWHTLSNARVTPTVAGWYRATFEVQWPSDTDYLTTRQFVAKNGSLGTQYGENRFFTASVTSTPSNATMSTLISLNGSTDYLEGYVSHTNTSAGAQTITARLMVELRYPT